MFGSFLGILARNVGGGNWNEQGGMEGWIREERSCFYLYIKLKNRNKGKLQQYSVKNCSLVLGVSKDRFLGIELFRSVRQVDNKDLFCPCSTCK